MQDAPRLYSGRISQLDSLRGVAAILVVVHHSIQGFAGSTADTYNGLAGHLDVGRVGVVIFFMLSGFVIARAVPGHDLKSVGLFFKHRFWRLYPPFWVSIVVATITAALVGQSDCCVWSEPTTINNIVANLTMLPLRFHQPALIGIYWTLELEMLFYVLIAFIALSRQTSYETMWIACSGFFIAAICVAGARVLNHGTGELGKDDTFMALLHLSLMFSGAALRYHWDQQPVIGSFFKTMPRTMQAYYFVVVAFFVGVVAIKIRHGVDAHTFRVAATYILAIVSFLGCLRFFRGSWLGTFLGNRSFGLYLLHLPIMSLVSLAMWEVPTLQMPYLVFLTVVLALSLTSADLLRRLVERPAIRFGHRAERGRQAVLEATMSQGGFNAETPMHN